MMDDIAEENELAEEIGTILAQPIGFQSEFDDVHEVDHSVVYRHSVVSPYFNPTSHSGYQVNQTLCCKNPLCRPH